MLKDIPFDVTEVYTRQHHQKGLQAPYDGPFEIEDRPSRSTVKICVGTYKSGEKRYEIRHFNDLKLAHPDSPAARAVRPALGRPPAQVNSPSVTEPQPSSQLVQNRFETHSSETSTNFLPSENKQTVANSEDAQHATSPTSEPVPTHAEPTFRSRQPARATRNPAPKYVDAIWVATKDEIAELNRQIGA